MAQEIARYFASPDGKDAIHNIHGTFQNNPTFIKDGPQGGGVRFEASKEQCFEVPISKQIEGDTSFSLFIKIDNPTKYMSKLFSRGDRLGDEDFYCLNQSDDNSSDFHPLLSGCVFFDKIMSGKWYHITFVFSKSSTEFWINGNLSGKKQSSQILKCSGNSTFIFAARSNKTQDFLSCCLEDIRVFKGVLTEQQIKDLALPLTDQQKWKSQQQVKAPQTPILNQQQPQQPQITPKQVQPVNIPEISRAELQKMFDDQNKVLQQLSNNYQEMKGQNEQILELNSKIEQEIQAVAKENQEIKKQISVESQEAKKQIVVLQQQNAALNGYVQQQSVMIGLLLKNLKGRQ